MEQFCCFDPSLDYIGKDALLKIHREGPKRQIRAVVFGGDKCTPCANVWPLLVDGENVGQITTAIWSPRLEANVSLAMVNKSHWDSETEFQVRCDDGELRNGTVKSLPLYASHSRPKLIP